MTTSIRSGGPQSIYPRLADTGGRIPFGLIDTNNSGRVSKAELTTALQRIFPSLDNKQCNAIADGAFSTLKNNGMHMDRDGWMVAEEVVLQSAKTVDSQNAMQRGTAPSGWMNATGMPPQGPMIIGQNQIPLPPAMMPGQMGYLPRNDFPVTGYNPYQYPMAMPPMMPGMMPGMPGYESGGTKMAKGAGRGLLGFLKMIPIVGNIINGIDFIKDIPKALKTFGNPMMPFSQKLKAGADLLFHGAGMFVPQVGGAYDMAQGAVRVAGGAMQAMTGQPFGSPWSTMPPFQFNPGGYNPIAQMPYAMNPMMNQMANPYMFGQFPNYTQYPPYPAGPSFMPDWLNQSFQQPYPMMPYGMNPMASMIPNYDPFMGAPYGYGGNPYLSSGAMSPMFGTPQDGIQGAGRAMLGGVKMIPGVGNIINGIDFIKDLGDMGRAMRGDPSKSFMKEASDLLFHGVGMLVPQVGGAYDMAQGTARMGAAAMSSFSYGSILPPYQFNPMGYPPVYPGMMY